MSCEEQRLEASELAEQLRELRDRWQDVSLLPEVLIRIMKHDPGRFRFVKVSQGEDGSWFAIAGVLNSDGVPLVCLAYGDTLLACMQKWEARMDGAYWQEDQYSGAVTKEGRVRYRLS